jgi:hypothetical protein
MMNTLRKNSQGYGYKYTDLAAIHSHMQEIGFSYWQEIETIGDEDYVITHILDADDKIIRSCRGCKVVKVSEKNPAQDYGSALTYARRYSLLLAFGLATSDDDAASLTNPDKPVRKVCKADRKPTEKPKVTPSTDKPYRQAGIDAVKHLIDTGVLSLAEVRSEVRKYGADRIQDLDADGFVRCVSSLTKGQSVL